MSGFQRKRRSGNDDYNENYQKRQRLPPMVELAKALCSDINTLGESSAKYVEDVEFMSVPIVSNFESEKSFRDAVLSTLFAIITEQPQKITHIAGLIQVINSNNEAIGKTIVEFFHQKAQELLDSSTDVGVKPESFETGTWNKLKLILRLLASLSFIINEEGLVNLFKQFLTLSVELQSSNEKRSPLGEALYYNTLLSIPYLTIYKPEFNQDLIKSLIEIADGFKIVSTDVTITSPFIQNSPFDQKDLVSLILPAIKNQIESPSDIFIGFREILNDQLKEQTKHDVPQLAFPSIDKLKDISGLDAGLGSVDGMWRTPRFTFQIYVPNDGLSTTPPTESYFGLLIKDITIDIVEALEFNKKEVARQIITLDLFFKNGLFSTPGSTIDALKEIQQRNIEDGSNYSTWKIEDIAVETVLSLTFKLPTASQPSVYFYTVLVEACTNASQAIAPVMGRAIRYFYANVANLDFELRLRYLDWISIQLSNFNFTWKWREWEDDAIKQSKSLFHPKIWFIKNLISKELRLTTHERIRGTITEEFQKYLTVTLYDDKEIEEYYNSLFSELKDVNLSFNEEQRTFFFIRENVPLKEKIESLIESIHKDTGTSEYVTIIESIKEEIKEYPTSNKLLISLLFQTIAFIGNRSISHTTRFFTNTSKVLKSIIEESGDENSELYAIEAILTYWNRDPHNGFLTVDIIESLGIISSLSKLKYLLNDDKKTNFALINISAIESTFNTLKSSVYSKENKNELIFTFNQLILILSKIVEDLKVNNDDIISIPDVDDDYNEINELKWKYQSTLGFIRSILRDFSDEYSNIESDLKVTIKESIKNEPTANTIVSWIDELKNL